MKTDMIKDSPADGGESRLSLDELASSIREEYAQFCMSFGKAIQHALSAGRLLIKAKQGVPHGGWLAWVEKNCELAERTAQLYMKLAKRVEDEPALLKANPQRVADLRVRDAIAVLAKPKSQKIDTGKSQGSVRSEPQPLNEIKALVKKLEQRLPPDCVLFFLTTTPIDPAAPALVDQLVASGERLGWTCVSEGAWMFMRSQGCTDALFESHPTVSTIVDRKDEVNLD